MDIVIETGGKLVPIEVKLSATPRPAMAGAIKSLQKDFGEKAMPGYVVHPGDVRLPLGSNVTALPFAELYRHKGRGRLWVGLIGSEHRTSNEIIRFGI